MSNQTSTETIIEQELYSIVKVLNNAMTLASRLAISDLSNSITKIGEYALKTTTLVTIKKASKKLIPLHMEAREVA